MSDKRYKRLGNYIELVQERNKGAHITNLMGVSIAKKFIPSIANIIGTDLSTYRIVHPGNFAFCPVTSRNGEKITIARYKGDEDCIISQAYLPFRVIDENKLDPDYLMMWVMRSEFDRYARFHSHGSVRELFSWEEMCNVYLPIPSIEEQRKIVAEYQAVEQRIENNNRLIKALEDTAQAIYHHTFVENIDPENLPEGWKHDLFYTYFSCKYGKGLATEFVEDLGIYPVYGANGIIGYYDKNTINDYKVLITSRGSGSGDILRTFYKNAFVTNNAFVVEAKPDYDYCELPFIYCLLLRANIRQYVSGSAQPQLTNNDLNSFYIEMPPKTLVQNFCRQTNDLFNQTYNLFKENSVLNKTKEILLSKLS